MHLVKFHQESRDPGLSMFIRIAPQFFNNESIVPAEKLYDCSSNRRLLICYLEQPRNINVANLCSRCGLDSCQVPPPFDSIQRHDISRNIKAADKNVIATFHAGLAVPLMDNKKHIRGFILPSEYLPSFKPPSFVY